jgi:lysophospholipase L1-like esterase
METHNSGQEKKLTAGRKALFALVSILLFVVLLLALGEGAVRLFGIARPAPPPPPPYNTMDRDVELGWTVKADYHYQGKMRDKAGVEYDLDLNTTVDGFRFFGDTASANPKIFFIGDSYTQSVEVSDDKAFYSIVKDSLPVEIFVYGAAGYGTYQEFLILERYFDRIRPDIVVLQVCNNDFIDNYHRLELNSSYRVGLRRPYLTPEGEVRYIRPVSFYERVLEISRFLKLLDGKVRGLKQKLRPRNPITAETLIYDHGRKYQDFDYSVKATSKALALMKEKVGSDAKLIAISSGYYIPESQVFEELFREHDIPFFPEPGRAVHDADYFGQSVKTQDGYHWNEAGHLIYAGELVKVLGALVH